MRDILNILNEAGRPSKSMARQSPIDRVALKAEVVETMRKLAEGPFSIRPDKEIAQKVLAIAKDLLSKWEDGTLFDALESILGRRTLDFGFFAVRREIESEERSYQERGAERHGFEDGNDNYIEDSDFLRAMSAQGRCANALAHINDPSNLGEIRKALVAINTFIDDYRAYESPSDGGEGPVLVESFSEGLASLLPLLVVVCSV